MGRRREKKRFVKRLPFEELEVQVKMVSRLVDLKYLHDVVEGAMKSMVQRNKSRY
jgi:hypothetical protein